MSTITDSPVVSREDRIAGLVELAEFLDTHPDVPTPHVFIHGNYAGRQALAQWVADLDELTIEDESSAYQRRLPRWFAGLKVDFTAATEDVTVDIEETKTVTTRQPLSVVDILDRAAAEVAS